MRATCATNLKAKGISDQAIAKTTGHRSLAALEEYTRVLPEERQKISHILSEPSTSSGEGSSNANVDNSATSTAIVSNDGSKSITININI